MPQPQPALLSLLPASVLPPFSSRSVTPLSLQKQEDLLVLATEKDITSSNKSRHKSSYQGCKR